MNQFWSEKETEVLLKMVEHGCSLDEIHSVITHRTRSAIGKKLGAMGIALRTRVPEINISEFNRIIKGKK